MIKFRLGSKIGLCLILFLLFFSSITVGGEDDCCYFDFGIKRDDAEKDDKMLLEIGRPDIIIRNEETLLAFTTLINGSRLFGFELYSSKNLEIKQYEFNESINHIKLNVVFKQSGKYMITVVAVAEIDGVKVFNRRNIEFVIEDDEDVKVGKNTIILTIGTILLVSATSSLFYRVKKSAEKS